MSRKRRKLKKATEAAPKRSITHDRFAADIPVGAKIVPESVPDPMGIAEFPTWNRERRQWDSEGAEKIQVARNLRDDCFMELVYRGCLDRQDAARNKILGAAGVKYREHWYLARLDPLAAFDIENPGGGAAGPSTPRSDALVMHRDRVIAAERAIGAEFISVIRLIVISNHLPARVGSILTGLSEGPETRAIAIDRLAMALARLVGHFGMENKARTALCPYAA